MVPQCATYAAGTRVFVRDGDRWVKAAVETSDAGLVVVATEDGGKISCPADQVYLQNLDHHDEEDMTRLAHLHEPGVLFNLETRYLDSNIYTFTGNILIAVNPFAQLPGLYGPSVMDQYRSADLHELPPHIYATVAAAYRQMLSEKQGQAILVTGESGAGKTETSKVIMRYLAHLGAPRHTGNQTIEQKVLESNPILEAFGNAKTVRNDNSSRFGKYLQLHFDAAGRICGAQVLTYLLERSRVVNVNNPERNYHIFYQLCLGAGEEERARWRLGSDAKAFQYLSRSTCFELPGVNHREEYLHVRSAMTCVGIAQDQQEAVLGVAAAVLHLGNLVFNPDESGEGSLLAAQAGPHLEAAGALLGVDPQELLRVLTTRSRNTFDGVIVSPLAPKAAAENRDSLAKVLYARLFAWLVAAINRSMAAGAVGGEGGEAVHTIGLLDIYGFESFAVNDFEQLCINLANEKLQQHFNTHVFKWEQAEYEAEGVSWQYISFQDNQDVLDLIEGKLGLLDHIDEQCRFPQATASDLALKLFNTPAVGQSARFTAPKSKGNSFVLSHYAGPVNYQLENFLEKNKDYIVGEHQALLQASSQPLLVELFGPPPAAANGNGVANGNAPNGKSRNAFQFASVGSQFRQQLGELAAVLGRMQPHYVRCIKPNAASRPLTFDTQYVLGQLKCGGVMEAVRISCAGFPYKRPFHSFIEYFWQLKPSVRDKGVEPRQGALLLLQAARVQEFHVGKTKVFLRGSAAAQLETLRTGVRGRAVVTLQRHCRGYQQRRRYRALRAAAVMVQAAVRGVLARREAERRRRLRAAVVVQAAWRGAVQRARLRELRAAVVLQAAWRGAVERARLRELRAAAVAMQAAWRGLAARRRVAVLREEWAAVAVQRAWRGLVARRECQRLRIERAATLLQAAWRARAVRLRHRQQTAAAVFIQQWWRELRGGGDGGGRLGGSFPKQLLAAVRRLRAAEVLQAAWRRRQRGRELAERVRSAAIQYRALWLAALAVQRSWRLRVAQRAARKHKMAARLKAFQQKTPEPKSVAVVGHSPDWRASRPRPGAALSPSSRFHSPGWPPRAKEGLEVVKGAEAGQLRGQVQADLQDEGMRSRISSLRQWWRQREAEASPGPTSPPLRRSRGSDAGLPPRPNGRT